MSDPAATVPTQTAPSPAAIAVWVVDDDASIRWVLEKSLSQEGMAVRVFEGSAELLDELADARPDVVLSDIRMPGVDGLALLDRLRVRWPELPVIIMTAHSDLDAAVASYKGGAFEYLPKPFDLDAAASLVRRAARPRGAASTAEPAAKLGRGTAPVSTPAGEDDDARTAAPAPAGLPSLIGEAPAMQDVFRAIGRLAASNITVLVTGESGTGKELVARALHETSPRARQPFIAVNTAAIPKDLLESEFFGHERGAFTGAATQRKGRFEQADGGTLFLDEIGDMPADLQTRLLRVLQNGEFYRVGGTTPIQVDVRVVAATHQNLDLLVQQGRFREDLFHRLNVIRVRIPALRERREDVPQLARLFLGRAAREQKAPPKYANAEVLAALAAYDWPGNVRELENTCRWLTVMAPGREIHVSDLPPELHAAVPAGAKPVGGVRPAASTTAATTGEGRQDGAGRLDAGVLEGRSEGSAPGVGATGTVANRASSSLPEGEQAASHSHALPTAAATNGNSADDDEADPCHAADPDLPRSQNWQRPLRAWAAAQLADGQDGILDCAAVVFERTLLEVALEASHGQRIEAARRLGWGRNTLTRKIKELGVGESGEVGVE